MQYQGRLVLITFVFLLTLIQNIELLRRLNSVLSITTFVLSLPAVWWLGKQYDTKKYQSERDPLTNIFNRRVIIEHRFPKLIQRSKKTREKIVVLYIDVDNFKYINDYFGHENGDLVLIRIAKILTHAAGKKSYVARWGGDEFLVLIPCRNKSLVKDLLHKLHSAFHEISKEYSTRISISIGLATCPDEGFLLQDLIKVAEQKMYREKEHSHFEQHLGSSKQRLHFISGMK